MKILIDDKEIKELPIPSSPYSLPMPIVDDNGDISIPGLVKRDNEPGKKEGSSNLSQMKKEIIALDATTSGLSQTALAEVHGVDQSTVSYLSKGFNRTSIDDRKVNEGVKEVIQTSRERIASVATEKLLKTLEHFVPETLDMKDKPGAALKLASVVEKVSQGFAGEGSNRPQFIVFSPRMRKEDHYEVIDIQAAESA